MTPQLTSYDLNAGKEQDEDMDGVGPASFAKVYAAASGGCRGIRHICTRMQPHRGGFVGDCHERPSLP